MSPGNAHSTLSCNVQSAVQCRRGLTSYHPAPAPIPCRSLISIEGSDAALAEQAALREAQAQQRAAACVAACRIDEIFADSKFLVGAGGRGWGCWFRGLPWA